MSAVVDVWQSPNGVYVLGIIISFIDKNRGKLVNFLLDLKVVPDETGKTMFEEFKDTLISFRIEDKLLAVVSDSGKECVIQIGGGNPTMMNNLEDYCKTTNSTFNKSMFWNRCFNHTFHRCVLGRRLLIK